LSVFVTFSITNIVKAGGHDFTIFNNAGMLQFDGGGSDPAVLQRVSDHVAKLSGVRPMVIVPNMQDTTEQLNLLLAGKKSTGFVSSRLGCLQVNFNAIK
jgi:predicted RecB family endonuclease